MTVTPSDLLIGTLDYVRDTVRHAVEGLSSEQLAYRVDSDANSIGWLTWHLTRVQDDHVSGVAGVEQAWTADGWSAKFDLPVEDGDIGYGHSSEQVASTAPTSAQLIADYADAVHDRTVDYLQTLRPSDLDRVVDHSGNPPVTLAVRLTSVVNDTLQHAGQAAFLRGVVDRRS